MSAYGLIYEVTLEVDPEVARDFDEWLSSHVAEMLKLPGFERADLETDAEPGESTRLRRTVRYQIRDRAALDGYFSRHATRMRQSSVERFGDRFSATRRILNTEPLGDHAHPDLMHCPNCGARQSGQYCARCGQRARRRMITLWELLREVLDEVLEHDSRLWRSVHPLLFRPGFLTREYLAGRRQRYVSPVRLYLFVSIAFFVIAFLAGPEGELTPEPAEPDITYEDDTARETDAAADRAAENAGETVTDAAEDADQPGFQCTNIHTGLSTGWSVLDRKLSRDAFVRSCERLMADPRAFGRAVLANLPEMMFFFLPLLALVLKFLYLGSRRYYSEHLLFAVHFHSFFFLIVTLDVLLGMALRALGAGTGLGPVATFIIMLYVPWYLYRGMRNVYDQHRIIRLLKYLTLVIAYFVSLVCMLVLTVAVTALTL
ncbi:hypothetical protein BH24PSE2_BH24PSE2_04860 [soil metagenome]